VGEVNMKPTDDASWITTAEAAERSGLPRPLVERILGRYPGDVRWSTDGAPPRVLADEFEAWIKPILAASDPGDLEQIRAEAILDNVPSTPYEQVCEITSIYDFAD
jgi:hypothetical protein